LDLDPPIPESAQDENELDGDNDGNNIDNNDDEGGDCGDDAWSMEVCIDEEDLLERLRTLFNICRECLLAKINTGQTP
jgi:hypothetical protein